MSTWFKRGKEAIEAAKAKSEEARISRESKGPLRLWLRHNSKIKGVFVDNPWFFLKEHSKEIAGNFRNYFTCLSDIEICPGCEVKDRAYDALVGTFLDFSSYVRDNGSKIVMQKKLFVAKSTAKDRLIEQIEMRNNNLKYCVYVISRGNNQKECATGEGFAYSKRVSRDTLIKYIKKRYSDEGVSCTDEIVEDLLTPYDYEKVLKPKSVVEMRKIFGGDIPIGAEEDNTIDGMEDSVEDDIDSSIEENVEDQELKSLDDLL